MTLSALPASFRDPSGFLFKHEGSLYRQVQPSYKTHYDRAEASGLFKSLIADGLLIGHREVNAGFGAPYAYKILQPEVIPFISYPYEWCFSELKNAALLTLSLQKKALAMGMVLKDASAYNVQFRGPNPVWIDTLSFEIYEEGKPWAAYRQFCEHFLAPLALMSQTDLRLGKLFLSYPDGIPLDLASRLLPFGSYFSLPILLNIHLQAGLQYQKTSLRQEKQTLSKPSLIRLIEHLENTVKNFQAKSQKSVWKKYSVSESYSDRGFQSKKDSVAEFLSAVSYKTVWDLGAHAGVFSAQAAEKAACVIAFESDDSAAEAHYQKLSGSGAPLKNILPLVADLTNPSPGIGWDNKERDSLQTRGPADLTMMLAVMHHLTIGKNVPLPRLASWLAGLCRYLIIEFVPKEDAKVQELLSRRTDIFPDYHQEGFEKAFAAYFKRIKQKTLLDSHRVLYLFEKI